jgi:ERCC4-type nuclease
MTIYIDPSELRENSNLLKYLSDVVYVPLSDLEAQTGADLMVSPDGLPHPSENLETHILSGAKLIQVKFGQDIAASIVDGRLDEQLARMQALPTHWWQRILLFVGIFSYDATKGMATINGQLSYTNPPLAWRNMQGMFIAWAEGGALDFPLASGKLMKNHLELHQMHANYIYKHGGREKIIMPKPERFIVGLPHPNSLIREWQARQTRLINDIRTILCAIPDAHIGPDKATAIFDYMAEHSISQNLDGLLGMVIGKKPELLKVDGIGKKTVEAIKAIFGELATERRISLPEKTHTPRKNAKEK